MNVAEYKYGLVYGLKLSLLHPKSAIASKNLPKRDFLPGESFLIE